MYIISIAMFILFLATMILYLVSNMRYKKKELEQRSTLLNNYKELCVDNCSIKMNTKEKLEKEIQNSKMSLGDLHKKTLEILTGDILND